MHRCSLSWNPLEPMRLHAEDAGDMGRTVCASRLYKRAIPFSHPVPCVKIADGPGVKSKTGQAVDHSLNGGVSAP